MNERLTQHILESIGAASGNVPSLRSVRSLSGGCINQAWAFECDGPDFFVKTNHERCLASYESEAIALEQLQATETICVPAPITSGRFEKVAFLVLEHLELQGGGDWKQLGDQLAQLHRESSGAREFGWSRDNVIGETPQPNPLSADWALFFRDSRIGHQLQLCAKKGLRFVGEDNLMASIPRILNHKPAASLLHGDLWSGNIAFLANGSPTIFDPATYFGDREVDLAFTEMFGRLSPEFYEAYLDAWPVPAGYQLRK
ncbi:MAG: fructosamine kinase family protein [Verrucomicrobiota bacterium]